jgi:hypothetical protein
MVARFAETMFAAEGGYKFEAAVAQLTLLGTNALGIPEAATVTSGVKSA